VGLGSLNGFDRGFSSTYHLDVFQLVLLISYRIFFSSNMRHVAPAVGTIFRARGWLGAVEYEAMDSSAIDHT